MPRAHVSRAGRPSTTTDDASVTVTATDGEHTPATQTFAWTAANVAPVIGTISTTATGPCSVALSAPFGDQGRAHGSCGPARES